MPSVRPFFNVQDFLLFMPSIVQKLSQTPISKVKFDGKSVSLDYGGKRLSYAVVKRNTCFVGNWSRSSTEVYYDAHLNDPVEIESICIHEAVEKYVTEAFKLDVDTQSHRIAQAIEKRWFQKHRRSWAYYNKQVTKIWREHGSC